MKIVPKKMNNPVKKKRLKALRSGDYEQCTRSLRKDDGYCCLGVLCDVYSKEKGTNWKKDSFGNFSFAGKDLTLPEKVVNWSGLNDSDPFISSKAKATVYNDDKKHSFKQIAALIDRNL